MEAEGNAAPASRESDPPGGPVAAPAADEFPRISIGRYSVPLRWALACARGDCSDCSGKGWIERVDQRGVRVLCHRCVIPRASRRLDEQMRAAQQLQVPLAPPGPDPAEQERHQRKVTALRRQLGELEDELTRRGVRHEKAVELERQACGALIAAEQEASTRVLVQSVKVDTMREEVSALERDLAARRQTLKGAEALLVAFRQEHTVAATKRAGAESPVQRSDERFAKDTVGLRKEIERARRRLDLALARWPQPGGGEGDVAATGDRTVGASPAGDPGLRPGPAGASPEIAR